MKDPKQLTSSRIQLHYAVQFIAATGAAIAEPQPDGSQVTSTWDPDIRGFVGIKLADDRPFYLALDPIALTSQILDQQKQAIAALPLAGQTMAAALDWHKAELKKLGITSEQADQIVFLNYPDDFPDHPLAHGAAFEAGDAEERAAIAAYFAQTRSLLQPIVDTQPGASPLHIWSHHFDLATLITLAGSGEDAKTIGIGLSPGDSSFDQPYWYVTPWPYPDPAHLPELSLGQWVTEGWVGAILRADQVGDPASQTAQQQIQAFLSQAVQASEVLVKGEG